MDLRTPIATIIPGVRGIVLGLLASIDLPLTGNRIAELAGDRASQSGVSKALGQLVASGIVHCQPAGSANLYTLNRDHVAAPAVMLASHLRETLLARIAGEVQTWAVAPTAVWLFGSAARVTGDSDSDIDVLLLRPDVITGDDKDWTEHTANLAVAVRDWSGNSCDLLEFGEAEFDGLVAQGDPIVVALRTEALPVFGDSPRQRIKARR